MGHHGLAILVPVLRRPQNVRPLLDSIAAATPEPYQVVFIRDPGDTGEMVAIREAGLGYLVCAGNYARKINMAVRKTTEPLLFLGADDVRFHSGWFEAAKAKLTGKVGCVGTQDLCNSRTIEGRHATHFLMARWYAELGTIDGKSGPLCELYPHEFCDDELVATAKKREAWAFADDSIVEHLHPSVGKAPMDDLYAAQPHRMRKGRRILRRRSHLWT